ncbi:MAG: hypothetical protein AB7P49_14130, partial [Bdellovibrionales bacterium]
VSSRTKMSHKRNLFTPSGRSRAFFSTDEWTVADRDGSGVDGMPYAEHGMHLMIDHPRPHALPTVHAHPPPAVGRSRMRLDLRELPNGHLEDIVRSRHGAVCWGESLEEALSGMKRLNTARTKTETEARRSMIGENPQ